MADLLMKAGVAIGLIGLAIVLLALAYYCVFGGNMGSSFTEFQRKRQSVGTVDREPYECIACHTPFRSDGDPAATTRLSRVTGRPTLTCPYCEFRQAAEWAKPGQKRSVQIHPQPFTGRRH